MHGDFKEIKTTQAATLLLSLNNDSMYYLKLVKLLYLIDREALLRWGRPVTFDNLVSMDQGTVTSTTLNLIREKVDPADFAYWYEHIHTLSHQRKVKLIENSNYDELSEAEKDLIVEIDNKFKKYSRWQLRDYTHKLPEWQDPKGTSVPISLFDIFGGEGRNNKEAEEIINDLQSLSYLDRTLT